MLITVTQEDIARGARWDCGTCPVALALTRAFGAQLHTSGAWVWRPTRDETAPLLRPLPPEVGLFVSRFDNHRPVEPFTFEADLEALR